MTAHAQTTMPLEYISRKVLTPTKWVLHRLVSIAFVLTHEDGFCAALVPSSRNRHCFAGLTIAYLDVASLQLLFVDVEKDDACDHLENLRKLGLLAVGDVQQFSNMIQQWSKVNEFQTTSVLIQVNVLDTPGYQPLLAFKPVEVPPPPEIQQPIILRQSEDLDVAAVAIQSLRRGTEKKRKADIDSILTTKRPSQTPITLKEYVLNVTPQGTTNIENK